MAKKIMVVLIVCFVCICVFASSVWSWGNSTIYVKVDSKYGKPVSWAYVAVDNRTCSGLGSGLYRITVSPGWHCVYVSGVYRWVYVRWGHNWVSVCL